MHLHLGFREPGSVAKTLTSSGLFSITFSPPNPALHFGYFVHQNPHVVASALPVFLPLYPATPPLPPAAAAPSVSICSAPH